NAGWIAFGTPKPKRSLHGGTNMHGKFFCRSGMGLGLLLAATSTALARVEGEALVGRPFGVGRITIGGGEAAIDLNRVLISDGGGRAFYPPLAHGWWGP